MEPPCPRPAARQGLWSLLTLQRSSHVPHRVDHMGPTLRGPHGCFWSPLFLRGPALWPSCSLARSNPVYSGTPACFLPLVSTCSAALGGPARFRGSTRRCGKSGAARKHSASSRSNKSVILGSQAGVGPYVRLLVLPAGP